MTLCKAPEDRRSAKICVESGRPLPIYLQALCPVSIFNFIRCRTFLLPGTWFGRLRDFLAVKFALPCSKAPCLRRLPNWLAFIFGAKSVLLSRVSLAKGCCFGLLKAVGWRRFRSQLECWKTSPGEVFVQWFKGGWVGREASPSLSIAKSCWYERECFWFGLCSTIRDEMSNWA